MTFLWPELLWLLLLLPACVGVYLWVLHRKKRSAIRYTSLGLLKEAAGKGVWWRRHLPPAFLLVALAAMLAAIARPAAVIITS